MPAHAVSPYLPMVAIAFLYYRRIRRSFGRQPWRPVRAGIRLAVLALVTVLLIVLGFLIPHVALGLVLGALAGVGLGLLALRHTHSEWRDGQGWYTPNPWIGALLMVLLLGRLAFRWASGAFAGGAAMAGSQTSPLTLGMAAALVMYSLVHVGGLWLRMRTLRGHTLPPVAPPPPPTVS